MTIWKYVSVFLFGALAAVLLYFLITNRSLSNKLESVTQQLDDCMHAPVRVDTVHDSIVINTASTFKPVPKPKPNVSTPKTPVQASGTTVPNNQEGVCTEWYSEVYSFKGGRIKWTAYIKNCKIEEMAFPEIVAPKELIYTTKTVDTCIRKKPEYKAKSHLGGYIGISANNFRTFPGFSGGIYVTVQDQILIQPGVLYLDGTLYGSLTLGVKFLTFNKK